MKKIILALLFISIFLSCKNDENANKITLGDFTFSSKTITQNESFHITYHGEGKLEDSFYHQMKNSQVFPVDLLFQNNTATITIPDSISAVAFNFKIDGSYENNNKQGFLFTVRDKSGDMLTVSDAALKYYAMSYGEQYEVEGDPKAALQAIEAALKSDPSLVKDWRQLHLYTANQVDATKGKKVGEMYITEITSKENMDLEDYKALSRMYSSMRNKVKSDSIVDIVIKKYPDSDLAFRPIIDKFFSIRDLKSKEALFSSHKEKFLSSNYADFIVSNLAMQHRSAGNKKKFDEYLTLVEDNMEKASLFNSIAWSNAEKGTDLEASSELSMQSLQLIAEEQKLLKNKPTYYSLNQYKNSLESNYNMFADTYALLAFKRGDIKDAVKYQSIAISTNNDPEMNERYIQFLLADKQYEKSKESAEKFLEEGNSTAKLKEYFKEAFKQSGDTSDVENVLIELESKVKKNKLESVRKILMNEKSIDFTLKNLDGEEVTLSSLKGKTVILDFWATWCGPCVASFPGMQKIVNKYKEDESVAFYFIDTFEDGEDRIEKVSKFIKDNNYSFDVLIDPTKENSRDHLVAKNYNISGIPTKIIIGPNGKVRFKSVGYSGSAEKTVSEIDAMVELLKTKP